MTQISLQENDTKLDGIESGATADQTDAEIRAAVEAATDSNVFTDDESLKLFGIETAANNYTHPTGAGNNHMPSGGTVGQVLENTASGTAQWADASGSIFPAFDNSTWTSMSLTTSGNNQTFTAPTGGNGIFFVSRIIIRSNNTSVYGSASASMSGTGSYAIVGGDYGGYLSSAGSAALSGLVAGNPINHGVQGFIAPGGTLTLSAVAPHYNMYFSLNGKYKSV